jgi:Spy/CpxP family protein refolding chaperone
VSKTISLNEEQKEQYNQIKHKYQKRAILVADSLHISQEVLMKEMMSAEQDSLRLREMEAKISYYQAQLLHLSVEQYYNIKTILTPEQIPALDRLFAQILICRPTCNHRDDDGGTIPHLN